MNGLALPGKSQLHFPAAIIQPLNNARLHEPIRPAADARLVSASAVNDPLRCAAPLLSERCNDPPFYDADTKSIPIDAGNTIAGFRGQAVELKRCEF